MRRRSATLAWPLSNDSLSGDGLLEPQPSMIVRTAGSTTNAPAKLVLGLDPSPAGLAG